MLALPSQLVISRIFCDSCGVHTMSNGNTVEEIAYQRLILLSGVHMLKNFKWQMSKDKTLHKILDCDAFIDEVHSICLLLYAEIAVPRVTPFKVVMVSYIICIATFKDKEFYMYRFNARSVSS